MKYIFGLILIIIVYNLSIFGLSKYLFEGYCNDKDLVGQFIYERVELSEEYFRPIPTDPKIYIEGGFYLDGKKLLIDKNRLKQSYTIKYLEDKTLSKIGPITAQEKQIVRKSDGKIISKSVTLLNMLNKKGTKNFPHVEGVTCLTKDRKGAYTTGELNIPHYSIIQNTFYKL